MADIGILFGLLAMLGWGVSDFLSKMAVHRVGVHRTLVYAYTTGTLIAVGAFLLYPRFSSMSIGIAFIFLVEAALNFAGYLFFYKGMEHDDISLLSPIVAAYPLIIVLLSLIILHEKITLLQAIAMFLIPVGLIALSAKSGSHGLRRRRGIALALGAMLIFGVSIFLYGYLVQATNWILALAVGRVLASLMILSFVAAKRSPLRIPLSATPLLIITGILEVGGTIGYSIGVSISQISLISVISSTYPLVVVALAWLFLREWLNTIQKLGVLGVIAGLVLISL
ncbi:MAG TPA: DMT family transporter [Candidatus Nanoarchaeia archaeon]|nr:DMT family transporter [Candidatus Nanoarchaeia archaeon]